MKLIMKIEEILEDVGRPLHPSFPGGRRRPRPVGLQPVSNSSTETSRARGNRVAEGGGEGAWKKDRRLAEGLTDTWPLNGANLRAPAVTLLFR